MWIRKSRQKTGNMCNIPILSVAKKLIEKYSDHPECLKHNVLLPVMSNQKMNAYLKEIADLCGMTKKLTTHVARHTCATVVMLANQVSMENVAKILGHSNTKMTQHYAKVLDSSIMRDMANVENCFANVYQSNNQSRMKRGEIAISENGVNITTENGTVWLSEYEIARLFEVFAAKISSNVRSILKSDVLRAGEVCYCYYYKNGSSVDLYNFEMITALAFRIHSPKADLFRKWLMKRAIMQSMYFIFNEENTMSLN